MSFLFSQASKTLTHETDKIRSALLSCHKNVCRILQLLKITTWSRLFYCWSDTTPTFYSRIKKWLADSTYVHAVRTWTRILARFALILGPQRCFTLILCCPVDRTVINLYQECSVKPSAQCTHHGNDLVAFLIQKAVFNPNYSFIEI